LFRATHRVNTAALVFGEKVRAQSRACLRREQSALAVCDAGAVVAHADQRLKSSGGPRGPTFA
jgi:hypothetical protein